MFELAKSRPLGGQRNSSYSAGKYLYIQNANVFYVLLLIGLILLLKTLFENNRTPSLRINQLEAYMRCSKPQFKILFKVLFSM